MFFVSGRFNGRQSWLQQHAVDLPVKPRVVPSGNCDQAQMLQTKIRAQIVYSPVSIVILFAITTTLLFQKSQALTYLPDKEALLQLYEATGGLEGNWVADAGWRNASSDPCDDQWFGLFVDSREGCTGRHGDAQRRVTWLELRHNGLRGNLGHALSLNKSNQHKYNVSHQQVVIADNQPLGKLQGLILASSKLSGHIPSNLGELSELQKIVLQDNLLEGPLPPTLGRLTKLRMIACAYNKLSGDIPLTYGKLHNLEDLFLEHNQLSGRVPPQVIQLSKLRAIDLGNNMFSGVVDPSWGSVGSRESIFVGGNPNLIFSPGMTLAQFCTNCASMVQLNFAGITGNTPFLSSVPYMPKLSQLDVSGLQLTGIIDSNISRRLPGLETLLATQNQLSGPIPRLPTSISTFVAPNNKFQHLPPFDNLHSLANLILDGNRHMRGQLPYHMGHMTRLQTISIQHCSLSGSLPSSLLDLSVSHSLHTIGLRDNIFRGQLHFPTNMTAFKSNGQASNLTKLDLGENEFTGSLPSALAVFLQFAPFLSTFRVDQNLLSCSLQPLSRLPKSMFAAHSDLQVVSSNAFACPMPESVKKLDRAADAATYACTDPLRDMLPQYVAGALLFVCVCVALVYAGRKLPTKAKCAGLVAVLEGIRNPSSILLLMGAAVVSLIHWGWIHSSAYNCPSFMWGSGAYHREASPGWLLISLHLLAAVLLFPLDAREHLNDVPSVRQTALRPSMSRRVEDLCQLVPNPARGQKQIACEKIRHLSQQFRTCVHQYLLPVLVCVGWVATILGIDLALIVIDENVADIQNKIPNAVVFSSFMASIIKLLLGNLLPKAASIVTGASSRYHQERKQNTAEGKALSKRDSLIAAVLLFTYIVPPLAVTMVQRADCFAAQMPWYEQALLPVSFQWERCFRVCTPADAPFLPNCKTRAGRPFCLETEMVSGTTDVPGQPLWRGTCASSGFRIFGMQIVLQLGIQGIMLLVACALELLTGLDTQQLQARVLRHLRSHQCKLSHTDNEREVAQGTVNPLAACKEQQCAERRANLAPPVQCKVAAGAQTSDEQSSSRQAADFPRIPLQQLITSGNSAVNEECTSSKTTYNPMQCQTLQATDAEFEEARGDTTHHQAPTATFQRLKASIVATLGVVYGAVLPMAAAMAGLVLMAYAVVWHLTPQAVSREGPVPRWLHGAMLVTFMACAWFAYGPTSMLEGRSAEGGRWVLILLSVSTLSVVLWLVLFGRKTPARLQAFCSACCSGPRAGKATRGAGYNTKGGTTTSGAYARDSRAESGCIELQARRQRPELAEQ